MKPPKGKKKGDKTPCDSSSTASRLLPLPERWQLKPENPFFLIFRLYHQQFLSVSCSKGLIDTEHLALAGDGPTVRTAAQQRKNESVIAGKMAVPPVIANVIIPSRIVTGDGTPIGNVISSAPPLPVCGLRFP